MKKHAVSHHFTVDHDKELVIVNFKNQVDYQEFQELNYEFRKMAMDKGYALTLDCTKASFTFGFNYLLTWIVDCSELDRTLSQTTTFFLLDKATYSAERLNQAWSPFKIPTFASNESLKELQSKLDQLPYGVWIR